MKRPVTEPSRPLFVYVKRDSFRRAEVAAFAGFLLNNQQAIARKARFVPLTAKQAKRARGDFRQALRSLARR